MELIDLGDEDQNTEPSLFNPPLRGVFAEEAVVVFGDMSRSEADLWTSGEAARRSGHFVRGSNAI